MTEITTVNIEKSRENVLHEEFQKPYFSQIKEFLESEIKA
jgi:uracil DNA glycosylase